MGKDRDTPVTGRAIPRPRPVEVVDFTKLPSEPPAPPITPTPQSPKSLDELYRLIDERLSPQIVQRISSTPPPSEAKTVEPRPSIPVRAAKATGRYGKGFMTIMGGVLLLLQGVAWVEEYRGPIQQGVAIVGKLIGLWEASRVVNEPELAPEPISPMLPAGE